MKPKHLIKKSVALSLIASAVCMTTGCDDTYDINKISGEMQLFENGLSAPVGNTTKFYLTKFIPENDILTVRNNRYAIHFNGNTETTVSIPPVELSPIAPTFEEASINFLESIYMIPGLQEALDATGYTSGPLPELGLEIEGITAVIPEKSESFSLDIPDVPAEIISISSIQPATQTNITVTLQSDGIPKQITQAKFDFRFKLPKELHIEPLQNDVLIDEEGFLNISRYVNCNNGAFTEQVPLHIISATFEPAAAPQDDGTITINTNLIYSGTITITDRFNCDNWDPDFKMIIGTESPAITIAETTARIEKTIDPVEYIYELQDLPEFLQNEKTCLDLTSIMIDFTVSNNTPGSLITDLNLSSEFLDGSTSGEPIKTLQPITIEPLATQHIVISNDDAYAGTQGYIPGLEALMYRVPRFIKAYATPTIPASDLTLTLGTEYNLMLDYDINVPITFGNDIQLYYEDTFSQLNLDLSEISGTTTSIDLEGDAISTLPLDLSMELIPLDTDGNTINDLTIDQTTTIGSNTTTHFSMAIKEQSKGALQRLDAIRFSVFGTARDGGELCPDQYLQFNNLRVILSDGISINQ